MSLKSLLHERLCRCDILDTYRKPPLALFIKVKARRKCAGRVARSYFVGKITCIQITIEAGPGFEGQVICSVNKLERVRDKNSEFLIALQPQGPFYRNLKIEPDGTDKYSRCKRAKRAPRKVGKTARQIIIYRRSPFDHVALHSFPSGIWQSQFSDQIHSVTTFCTES